MHFFKYSLFISICFYAYYTEAATVLNSSNVDGGHNVFSIQSSILPLSESGEKSYYIPQFKLTFLEAFQFCQEIEMKLVTVHSLEEVDALAKFARQTSNELIFWTSGSKLVDNRNWIWLSTMELVEYIKWSNGQPDFLTEQCLELWFLDMEGLSFNNEDCNAKHAFICEREKHTPRVNRETENSSCLSSSESQHTWQNPTLLHFEGKNYYIGNYFKANFMQAGQFCEIIGMKLVSIDSEAEAKRLYRYIRDTIAGDSFWSSGTKLADGKGIIWLSTETVADYTNWLPNQPDDPKEMCLQLVQRREEGLFWNDLNCDVKLFFICEQDDNILSQIPEPIPEQKPITSQPIANVDESVTRYTDNPTLPVTIIDGVRYRVSKFETTQEKASQTCQQYGMELVSILDKEKNDAIIKLIQHNSNATTYYWTSATKQPDKKWTWWELQPMIYTNWAAGQPNNAEKSALCLGFSYPYGQWYYVKCDHEFYFICEKRDFSSDLCNSRSTPTVNIYVNNNQDDENEPITPKTVSSEGDRAYNFVINNNIGTCNTRRGVLGTL